MGGRKVLPIRRRGNAIRALGTPEKARQIQFLIAMLAAELCGEPSCRSTKEQYRCRHERGDDRNLAGALGRLLGSRLGLLELGKRIVHALLSLRLGDVHSACGASGDVITVGLL